MNIPINNSVKSNTANFTNDQKAAYKGIIDFIDSPFDPNDYKRCLVGAAGTGKTYLVKALILNCQMSYSMIGLAAPTHKACRVLGESINIAGIESKTLQSGLGLRLNFDIDKFDPNHPPFDPKGKIKIGDYKLYIVDEASMINRGLCTFLERICKTNKCKLLYIGDANQLAAVGEKYSSAFRGVKTFTLKEIVRQDDDNPVRYLLELLRYDIEHKSYNFLQHIQRFRSKFDADYLKGYQVCTTEEFSDIVKINFSDEQLTHNVDFAKVIAYTNACVSMWNKFIRNSTIADCDKSIITKNDLIISYSTIVNVFNECVIKNSEEYIIKDIVNYKHTKYDLKGFLIKFQAIHGGNVTAPLFVVDHSDTFTIQRYIQVSNALADAAKSARANIRAQKWKDFFEFKESALLLTNIMSQDMKIMFPRGLDYGFALTAHKSLA